MTQTQTELDFEILNSSKASSGEKLREKIQILTEQVSNFFELFKPKRWRIKKTPRRIGLRRIKKL